MMTEINPQLCDETSSGSPAKELITLRAGPLCLRLSPRTGGSIARFDYYDSGSILPILRGHDGIPASPLQAASFPLVPYVNRIRSGCFTFGGRTIRLSPNMEGDANPLHGQGWISAWRVAARGQREAHLTFRHEADEWPWRYEAVQRFRLDEGGLQVDLVCRNLDSRPMPCGLGQHPYFPCTPATRLETQVTDVWTVDEAVLPVERQPVSGPYALDGRPICGRSLDNGYAGWSGQARIQAPESRLELLMSCPDAGFFQLYSPRAGGVFVAEPVTHANAALNEPEESWTALGLRILHPGEEMTLRMRIEVSRR